MREQRRRWGIEDERVAPIVSLIVDRNVTIDGWHHGVIDVRNRLEAEIEVERVEAVEPHNLRLCHVRPNDNQAVGPPASPPWNTRRDLVRTIGKGRTPDGELIFSFGSGRGGGLPRPRGHGPLHHQRDGSSEATMAQGCVGNSACRTSGSLRPPDRQLTRNQPEPIVTPDACILSIAC
jgi:hypothetical protein